MARRRTVNITETTEEIQQLREHYTGTPTARALHFLILLKEDRRRTIASCAEEAGFSARKGERIWKRYREIGLRGVVGGGGNRQRGVTRALEAQSTLDPPKHGGLTRLLYQSAVIDSQLESVEWVKSIRELLYGILPSVSYIVVNIANTAVLDGVPSIGMIRETISPTGTNHIVVQESGLYESNAARILTDAPLIGVDLGDYRIPPYSVDIYFQNEKSRSELRAGSYLGTVIFFASAEGFETSDPTGITLDDINMIELLMPYLTQLFANFLMRRASWSTARADVGEFFNDIASEFSLTKAETRMLWFLLFGKQDAEMAEILSVSVSTVRTHVSSILRKTGSRDRRALLSKVFVAAGVISKSI